MKKLISSLLAAVMLSASITTAIPEMATTAFAVSSYDSSAVSYSAAPTAVTGLKYTATTKNSITLGWTKNTTADSYKIKQVINGQLKEIVKTSSNSITSYTINNLSPNTEYQFNVYAFKGTQYSSAAIIKVKTAAEKPTAVTGLKYTATTKNSITLGWTKNTTADSYKIKQVVNGQLKEIVKTSNNSTTSYTINNLSPNTEYQFNVYAFSGTQYSSAAIIKVKTAAEKPTAVTGLKYTATTKNSITLGWTKNTTADSYKIKQVVNGQLKEIVKTSNNSTTSYTINNLSPNTEYQFNVYAFSGTQYSSAAIIKVKTAADKPTAVTGLKGTATTNSVTLSWTKNTTADSYKIKQVVNGQLKEIVKTSNNSTTSYTINNLSPNTEYQFNVYAFSGTQYSSAAIIKVKTAADKPTAVTGLKGTATTNSVTLSWTKNTTADSYKVKQIVNGQLKELVKTANNSTTSYTVTGLKPNTSYEFSVYAFNGTAYSTAAKITVKTKSSSSLAAVTGLKGTATKDIYLTDNILLTWNRNTSVDGYKISQYTNGAWKELAVTDSNAITSYAVMGNNVDKEYTFAVYTYKGTTVSDAETVTISAPDMCSWDSSILYDYKAKWAYNQLSANQQTAYGRLFDAVQIHAASVPVSDLNLTTNDISLIYWSFDYDNPQFLALGSGFSYSYYSNGTVVSLIVTYGRTAEEVAAIQEEFDKVTLDVIKRSKILYSSNLDRMRFFHDWIVDNTEYFIGNTKYESEADGPVVYGKALCEGYSKAFMYFCQSVGIPCVCVSGTGNGGGHMWNVAQVNGVANKDGYWAYFDVTWDDPITNTGEQILRHDYFKISANTLAKDHKIDNKFPLPAVAACF